MTRRGLYVIDGKSLDDMRVRAAYFGSVADTNVVWLAVADMVNNICGDEIARVWLEYCLENRHWPPNWWDEVRRYADDIIADWSRYGAPSVLSLHDTCLNVIENIRDIGSGLPQRSLPSGKYFVGGTIGGAPKSIHPASPAPEYVFGQGHGVIPDGITHPLMTHLASDEPCALKPILAGKNNGYTPHHQTNCGARFTVKTATPNLPTYTSYERTFGATQHEKVAAIRKLVVDAEPTYASLHETGGRHNLLVCGDNINAASVYIGTENIRKRYGTPFDCMVTDHTELDDLLCDAGGNDAKIIVQNGQTLAGKDPIFTGYAKPPQPATFTKNEMLFNMERYGFKMLGSPPSLNEKLIRPEYIMTATHFSMEPRWFITGMAVMLYKCKINWSLLSYLADMYGYTGTLYGIVDSLYRHGRDFRRPINAWRNCRIKSIPTEDKTIRDALRIYRC